MAEKIKLSKKDRMSVAWRHQFLQGSWNYERMQNGGWCYSIIPAIKKWNFTILIHMYQRQSWVLH